MLDAGTDPAQNSRRATFAVLSYVMREPAASLSDLALAASGDGDRRSCSPSRTAVMTGIPSPGQSPTSNTGAVGASDR